MSSAQFPKYLYGLHDIGGHDRLLSANKPGWVLDAVDLRAQTGTDYTSLAESGLGVMVQLQDAGAFPSSDRYADFAARAATYARNSPGARVWIIGNAINTRAAQPRLRDGAREMITPILCAQCYRLCRAAIKNIPSHADDLILPSAVTPFDIESGDWINYFSDVLNLLSTADGAPEVDGIALNAFTHDYNLNQITSDDLMDAPFERRHFNFRAYRDFLAALPDSFRALPVFITAARPLSGWRDQNIGWIQRAYQEINDWNAAPAHQPIHALVLHHWRATRTDDATSIQDKPALMDDLRAALAAGYRARWTETPLIAAPRDRAEKITAIARVEQSTLSILVATESVEKFVSPDAPISNSQTAEPTRAELIMPAPAPVLPAQPEWRAEFRAHNTPVNLTVGQSVTVNLRVKNIGARAWSHNGDANILIGYRWMKANANTPIAAEDRRTALPREVAPDGEIDCGAVLVAPRAAGVYKLHWDLIARGSEWFADLKSAPLIVAVTVVNVPQEITGWRVESNLNSATVSRALDGDAKTFWDSGAPQAAHQWFRLDFGAPRVMDGIQFLSPGKGFPAHYSLRLSADGKTWIEISRVQNNAQDVLAVFAPIVAQYAQIDLIAPANDAWMISEILAHRAVEWRAQASHSAENASRALDDRADSAWSSGDAQTPGMWFQIDLGNVENVSGLGLIAANGEFPRGARVATWNAGANRWQIATEKINLQRDAEFIFPTAPTQFINIQLVQSADAAWSIRHARVYREMENWLGPKKVE